LIPSTDRRLVFLNLLAPCGVAASDMMLAQTAIFSKFSQCKWCVGVLGFSCTGVI
jgi:hypothetical protein